jgi:hypothetical protein
MGKCPSCGAKSIFGLKTWKCFYCGKVVCVRCMPSFNSFWFKTGIEYKDGSSPHYEYVGFCSSKCFEEFWDKVLSFPADDYMETDISNFEKNWVKYWNESILAALPECKGGLQVEKVRQSTNFQTERFPAFPWIDSSNNLGPYSKKSRYKAKLALAGNLVRCGRDLDAADIYEKLKLYVKARELRKKDKHIFIKRTNVSVNLNSLLRQVKDNGIVAVYRCPHCNANLKVGKDTTMESLRKCAHCGSEVETMDLADFLETALE